METVSIVTVCLNEEKNIEATIRSVLDLHSFNYEYIVKDGKSQDATLDILHRYDTAFSEKGIHFKVISEKDCGIYDAMNQSITYCNNNWIIFMNAGDVFFDANVLNDVFYRNIDENIGIISGHSEYLLSHEYKLVVKSNIVLSSQISICHQAVFFRRDFIISNQSPFNCKYQLAADRELIFRMLEKGIKADNVNVIICKYNRKGISSTCYKRLNWEINEINRQYGVETRKNKKWISWVKDIINKITPSLADISLCIKNMRK